MDTNMKDESAAMDGTTEFVKDVKIDDDDEPNAGNLMRITESSNLKLGTSGRIYSMILAKYLFRQVDEGNIVLQGKNVLELGCGTGCLSIFLAGLGANVVASDLLIAQPLVEKNLKANEGLTKNRVRFVTIDWNLDEEPLFNILKKQVNLSHVDYIVASDVYFNSNMFDVFSATLKSVNDFYLRQSSENGKSNQLQAFIAYKQRLHEDINDDPVQKVFQVYKFPAQRVHKNDLHANYRQKDVEIFTVDFSD